MPAAGLNNIYKVAAQITAEALAAWVARVPDLATNPEAVAAIWCWVFGQVLEGNYLAMQLLHDDQFIQTASAQALQMYGQQYGRLQRTGTPSTGSVRFAGAGGTFIAAGSQVGAPRPALGDTLQFETTEDATIPNPGTPTAPVIVDHGSGTSLIAATYEYAVTFLTAAGQTEIGVASAPLVLTTTHSIDVSSIPLGGPGTTARRVYRRKNGGDWASLPATIADNTTTTVTDNHDDDTLGGAPPDASTAEQITVTAQSVATGTDYNVLPGSITVLVSVEGDVNGVVNDGAFVDGSDQETIEVFRANLQKWVADPQSGSPDDLVDWALEVDGIATAAVFKNVNLDGDDELGSVVVRVAGPAGSLPSDDEVAAVQANIDSKDLANITIYVGTFDELTFDPVITVTLMSGYSLGDVSDSAAQAVADYINSIPVGGTVFVNGIVHAVFPLPGIATVTVTTPAVDTTATDVQKPITDPGSVTVTT